MYLIYKYMSINAYLVRNLFYKKMLDFIETWLMSFLLAVPHTKVGTVKICTDKAVIEMFL